MILSKTISINPDTVYAVEVIRAKEITSKSGGEMLVLTVRITPGNYTAKEFISDNTPKWRIEALTASLNYRDQQGEHVVPSDFIGLTGRAMLETENYNGDEQIKIAKWLPPESPSAAPEPTEIEPAH